MAQPTELTVTTLSRSWDANARGREQTYGECEGITGRSESTVWVPKPLGGLPTEPDYSGTKRESWWLDFPRHCSRFPTSLPTQPVADNPCPAGSDGLSGPHKMRPRLPWSVRRVGRISMCHRSYGSSGSS